MENENKIIPGQDTPEVVEEAVVNDAAPAPEVTEEAVANEVAPTQEVVAEQPETTEKRCPKCFALIADEQMFCPECGVPVKKMCANCKTELQDDQSFCPVCGTMAQVNNPAVAPNGVQYNDALNAPKKKFKAWPIIVGVVAVVVLIMALIISNSIKEKKIEEYVAKAQNFYTTVLNSGAEMEDIGNEIQTAWGKYVVNSRYGTYYNGHYIYSIESAVSAAQDETSTEISNVQSTDGTIESMYRFLMDVPDSAARLISCK